MNLRLRLAIMYTVLALLGVISVSTVSGVLLMQALNRQFLTRLNEQADQIAAGFNNPNAALLNQSQKFSGRTLVQVSLPGGQKLISSPNIESHTEMLPLGRSTLDGTVIWAVTRKWNQLGARIWVALPAGDLVDVQHTVIRVIGLGALVTAVVILLLGVWLGRWMLRGLEQAAEQADKIGPDSADLMVLPARQDEIYSLMSALNRLLERIWNQKNFEKRFIGQVAHELGAPLTSLQGYLKLAHNKSPLAEINQASQVAFELQFVSQDLMQLARGRSEISLGLHYLPAVVLQERLERLTQQIEFVGFTASVYVLCDPDRLVQALRNLLANARRAAGDTGLVRLTLEEHAEHLAFVVRDSGPGLPPGVEERIFEAFFSRSNSSGLGLSVASNIAELHGGQLSARNHPEGGAEFTLTIPHPVEEEDNGSTHWG